MSNFKPDISVGYVLRQFDLTSHDDETSENKMTTSDFVVLTDRDEIVQKKRRRKTSVGDDKEKDGDDNESPFFTVWSVSSYFERIEFYFHGRDN
jgi:hypothetical protein